MREFRSISFAAIRAANAHDGLPSMKIGLGAGALFVKHMPGPEPVEPVGGGGFMMVIARD
jgi:hypothetical protein